MHHGTAAPRAKFLAVELDETTDVAVHELHRRYAPALAIETVLARLVMLGLALVQHHEGCLLQSVGDDRLEAAATITGPPAWLPTTRKAPSAMRRAHPRTSAAQ